jgi:hypothetical protein
MTTAQDGGKVVSLTHRQREKRSSDTETVAVGCFQSSEMLRCSTGKADPNFFNDGVACILKASWSVFEQLKMKVMWPLEPLGVAQMCSVTSQTTGVLY